MYDSGNEEQQCAISNAIDTINKDPVHFQRSHSKHGSFCQTMNEWRIQLSIFSTENELLLNLRIITFITALLIFAMARILFNIKIIIENAKDVRYIPLILLMTGNFSIFRWVENSFLCKTILLQKCKIRTLKMKLINYLTFTCFTCCHNHGHNMFCTSMSLTL